MKAKLSNEILYSNKAHASQEKNELFVSERELSYMYKYEPDINACDKIHNPKEIFTCSKSTIRTTENGVEYV